MSHHCHLQVIRVEHVQWKPFLHGKEPKLYVEAKLGSSVQKTRVINRCASPIWNETLVFTLSDESATFQFQVKHKSILLSDPCIGAANIRLVDLLAKSKDGEAILNLSTSSPRASTTPSPIIALRLEAYDAMTAAQDIIDSASEDVRSSKIPRLEQASDVVQSISDSIAHMDSQSDLYKAIGELLLRLDAFKRFAKALSDIHPLLTVVWNLSSILFKAVKNVFETDQRVVHLVQVMTDAFTFVSDVQILQKRISNLRESIVGLLEQTIECCLFVRQYVQRHFFKRMLDLGSTQKIDNFEHALASFKQQIESGVVLHTAFVSMRTSERLDDLSLLQRLNPSSMDGFHRADCLPGTRKDIRAQIIEWMFSPDTEQNIFWLCGVAGSGKSSISTTIANQLREMLRLGAYLFFERSKSEPSSVIRTIAYKLALFDSSIGSSILCEIEADKDIVTASPLHQFRKLLLQPLQGITNSISGPIAIVLDALDECGTPEGRHCLVELFQKEFPKLPNNFRILITSRREVDIDELLSSQPMNIRISELDYTSETSQRDVLTYLHYEMHRTVRERVRLPEGWPWDRNMELLGKAAGGLFIWASTAVKMVKNSNSKFNRLKCLITESRALSEFGLDELYASVIQSSGIMWNDPESRETFRKVMSLVLLSKIPVSSEDIDGILEYPPHQSSTEILSSLRSVVSYSPGKPIHLLHTSFSDYLLSPNRSSDPWFIDISAAQHLIVIRCFSIMDDLLRFNICGLESSFVHNDNIPDLDDRVKASIPSHLKYACIYWSHHLAQSPFSPGILDKLSTFAHCRLLFWFEVISLVREFGRVASYALGDAALWSEPHETGLASFLRDASKLSTIFALPITQSTPHIYVSMVPLSETDSRVARFYSTYMSSFVKVEIKGIKKPTLCLKALEGHRDNVRSVVFSPNGKRIASASNDMTVRLWDVGDGKEIFAPLTGHTGIVPSVCFSPDGGRIVSGSADCTLRIWDACNGNALFGPLNKHSESILSVAWSPDGTRIASGSEDGIVIVWDARDGKVVSILEGHTGWICTVAYSPDSRLLTSESSMDQIQIRDVTTGDLVFGPFENHFHPIVLSPDGKYIASGSHRRTIRVLEVESGRVISTLEGHTGYVESMAYFPCGTRIVSGSWDRTIIVWDAESGSIVSTLEGHINEVNSVTVSPDGKYIASGSDDNTIRIWDAIAVNDDDDSESATKHSAPVTSVSISPDGNRIASACHDGSIIVWNAHTGHVVLGPLIGHEDSITSVRFSADGSRLFSGSGDGTMRIWDAKTGESACNPEVHPEVVSCVAVSPRNSTIVTSSCDGTIRVFGELVSGPLRDNPGTSWSITFSPDGGRLASGTVGGSITIWNTETWEVIFGPLTGHIGAVKSVCFSSDGSQLASASEDSTIVIWDVESQQKIAGPFEGHRGPIDAVLFSLDGKNIISGSQDNTIRVWNIENGQAFCELVGHRCIVTSLALSLDGCRVVSGSHDHTIRIWDLSDVLSEGADDSPSDCDMPDWILGENGWVLGGPDGRDLLLWIPPELRTTLRSPRTTAILSCDFETKLDFTGAALGERWSECFIAR